MIFGLASAGGAGFSVSGAVVEFLKVSLGGLAVGMALGYLVSNVLLKHLDDHLIETAITLALAFGAYVAAEQIHVSGILAVVAAGIIVGDIGLQNTSPTTRLSLLNFWELLSFVVNAFVFLLIGLRVDIELMADNLARILVAVVTILLRESGDHVRHVLGTESRDRNPVSAAQLPTYDVLGWTTRRGQPGIGADVDLLLRIRRGRSVARHDIWCGPLHAARSGNHHQMVAHQSGLDRDL